MECNDVGDGWLEMLFRVFDECCFLSERITNTRALVVDANAEDRQMY